MPVTFDAFGVRFLYPDNWKQLERGESEGDQGVTLEMPGGGFFTIEQVDPLQSPQQVIDQVATSIREEYKEVEQEPVTLPEAGPDEQAIDFRFYYLDLLIVSRLIVMPREAGLLMVQMQAENRDFDENELVFAALLKQLRDS